MMPRLPVYRGMPDPEEETVADEWLFPADLAAIQRLNGDVGPGSTPPLSSRDTVPVDEEDADGEM